MDNPELGRIYKFINGKWAYVEVPKAEEERYNRQIAKYSEKLAIAIDEQLVKDIISAAREKCMREFPVGSPCMYLLYNYALHQAF